MTDLDKARAEATFWLNAWREQREATGRAWWAGYREGLSMRSGELSHPAIVAQAKFGRPEDG
jgi:ribosome modulation factor